MITQQYNLNLIPNSAITLVKCSQYDRTLRALTFNLFEGSTVFQIPAGTTATISGTKPDKTGFSYEMTVNTSSVSIDVTEQMTAVAGPVVCEVTLTDGDGQISTANFVLQVEPSALAGTEISETEIPILQEAIEAAETVISLSETFGSPLVAQTAAEMTLTNRVYVYTGSESGYVNGNWYYYDGSAWVSGGVYNSTGITIDTELSETSTHVVQNKAITTELNSLKTANAKKAPVIVSHAEGSVASFSDGAGDMPVSDLTVSIEPVQSGSGDPSPTNVRPISGWTGMNLTKTGANIIGGTALMNAVKTAVPSATISDENVTVYYAASATRVGWVYENFKPNTQYTFIITLANTSANTSTNLRVTYTDGTGTALVKSANTDKQTIVMTSAAGKSIAYFQTMWQDGGTTVYCAESGIFEGVLTESDFEPYNATTYSVDWTSEAGTVYGGTLDVTTGVLTVNMGMVDLGTLSWNINNASANIFDCNIPDIKPPVSPPYNNRLKGAICSRYAPSRSYSISSGTTDKSWVRLATSLYIRDSDYTDAASFKTALSGTTLVYELVTPITYQLTPTEVKTLLGYNNIYSDTGSSSVDYCADTKLYIDGLSQSDDDMIADTNIASGKYFTVNNKLYLSTAAIAQGASIVVGTNCTETNIAEALNALNA